MEFVEKIMSFFMSIIVFFAGLFGINIGNTDETPKISQTTVMSISVDSTNTGIRQVEGGCYADGYIYEVMIVPLASGATTEEKENVEGKIIKIDAKTWTVVKESETTTVMNHANGLTYVPNEDSSKSEIIVTNNDPNFTRITYFNAETLEHEEEKDTELSQPIYSLTYVGSEDCYFAGISKTYNIVKYDSTLKNEMGTMSLVDNGYTRQTIEAYEGYLYCVYYKANSIYKYDYYGNLIGICTLPESTMEAENVFFLNGEMYVTYNITGVGNGGEIDKISNWSFTAAE